MRYTKTLVTLAASAVATLVVASSSIEPAAARGGHGGHSFSGGHSWGGGRSFSRTFRSRLIGSSQVYGYRSIGNRHHRHFRGGGVVYGYPYYDGYYGYSDGYSSSCYWLRSRALATGSPYWWDRYYACIDGYSYY